MSTSPQGINIVSNCSSNQLQNADDAQSSKSGSILEQEEAAQSQVTLEASTTTSPLKKIKRNSLQRNTSCNKVTLSMDACLLLEYATLDCVPQHVQQLLSHYDKRKLNQAQALILLVYIVALECGFAIDSDYENLKDELEPVPISSCFHAQNVRLLTQESAAVNTILDFDNCCRIQLRTIIAACGGNSVERITCSSSSKALVETTLSNDDAADDANDDDVAEATEAKILSSQLIAVITGDLLLLTLSPATPSTERGFSICLPIGRYVLNTQAKGKPLFHRFRKLNDLSMELRDKLFHPLRAQQLALLNVQVYPTLVGLPAELYDEIFQHLTENQLKIVANVNKHLNYYSTHSKHRFFF